MTVLELIISAVCLIVIFRLLVTSGILCTLPGGLGEYFIERYGDRFNYFKVWTISKYKQEKRMNPNIHIEILEEDGSYIYKILGFYNYNLKGSGCAKYLGCPSDENSSDTVPYTFDTKRTC